MKEYLAFKCSCFCINSQSTTCNWVRRHSRLGQTLFGNLVCSNGKWYGVYSSTAALPSYNQSTYFGLKTTKQWLICGFFRWDQYEGFSDQSEVLEVCLLYKKQMFYVCASRLWRARVQLFALFQPNKDDLNMFTVRLADKNVKYDTCKTADSKGMQWGHTRFSQWDLDSLKCVSVKQMMWPIEKQGGREQLLHIFLLHWPWSNQRRCFEKWPNRLCNAKHSWG